MKRRTTARERTLVDYLFAIAFFGFLLYVVILWWNDELGGKVSQLVAWLEQFFTG